MRFELPLVALWLALAGGLSLLSTRVVDWFVMTDELLYERLGISVDRLHSPLPHVHGELVPNVSQLYPLLLATVYGHGLVPQSLHDAHLLNAFVMSSAAIPAFLLTRRVTGRRLAAYPVAALTVSVPWIVYSSFLLTEVAGYPAFLWAVLAIQAATVAPSARRDVVAIAALTLAVFARTQFFVLFLVLPIALILYELGRSRAGRRARDSVSLAARRHRALVAFYLLLVVGLIALLAVGRVSSLLGTYADTLEGNLVPNGIGRSLLAHLAQLALSAAILPFVIGGGWLLSAVVRPAASEAYAFAVIALTTITAVVLEVTIFDLRFGSGLVRDRYLFYVVPLLLIAFAASLGVDWWPRRTLAIPAGLAIAGFLVARLPVYEGLNADSPISAVVLYVRRSVHSLEAARLTLAIGTLLVTVLFLQGSVLLRRSSLVAVLAVIVIVALPVETGYAYVQFFGHPGTSGRPLTLQQGSVFDWVDQTVGTNADVTMLPYPSIDGDYWASVAYWWDVEFWNKSIDAAAYYAGEFEGTPSTFPKLHLRFDPATGASNISPSRFVVVNQKETRFRIDGTEAAVDRGAFLIDTGGTWTADWMSFGLYDDGWTRPGVVGRVRVFPAPGQVVPRMRSLVVHIESPAEGRPVEIVSNAGTWRGKVSASLGSVVASVPLCQPAHGFTDVRIRVQGETPVHGDMRDVNSFGAQYRTAGVFLAGINLEGIGADCRPGG